MPLAYIPLDEPQKSPCENNPCGSNAICKERNGVGSCTCLPDYFGDPYIGCRPECLLNDHCSKNRACINNKCKDPCPGICGRNAECFVINHSPSCECLSGYTGNPSVGCHETPKSMFLHISFECLLIHFFIYLSKLLLQSMYALPIPVDPSANVEVPTVMLCAHVYQIILEVLPTVGQSV